MNGETASWPARLTWARTPGPGLRTTLRRLAVDGPGHQVIALFKEPEWFFSGDAPGLSAGALYRYRVDGQGPFPDPVSRFQPDGVHGPSEIIDAARFAWTDRSGGVPRRRARHRRAAIGTFTPEGTFDAVSRRLPRLAELGITAIELLPVADFPGAATGATTA